LETDETVRAIKEADEKLDAGSPAEAVAIVDKTIPHLPEAQVVVGSTKKWDLLLNRSIRIYALASVRLGGAVGPYQPQYPGARRRNVGWATTRLKGLAAVKPGDAVAKGDYGEALAASKPAEAKKILEELAEKDVLATPYAYAALARLRDAGGDAAGRD